MSRRERVCGTPVERAHDDHRRHTVLLSDLHLQGAGGRALELLGHVLAGAADDAAATRVVVLGDLFDVWIGARQMRAPGWSEAADLLRQATGRGLSVTVLHGNRDFMLDDRFAAHTGCRVVPGGLRLCCGGVETLCLHGDELVWNDRPYQRAKRFLRHPATRAALRSLPAPLALRAAGGVRARSAVSREQGDALRFAPVEEAVGEALHGATARLVFGHVHRAARGRTPDGEYLVLPAFDEAGHHVRVDAAGTARFVDVDGRDVEEQPGPFPLGRAVRRE